MTTRNLDALFQPKAIAIVGASAEVGSVGHVVARNALEGRFAGRIMLVNPHAVRIGETASFPTIDALPEAPDLAVIATPIATVPGIIGQLGRKGCRAAVVISAGAHGPLREAILSAARPYLMRIIGPNCVGFLSPPAGINASFAHRMPPAGELAFITQSGALATSVIDWAAGHALGFSHIVSLGDMADVDLGDLLDFLALDPQTRAILIYAESVTQARKFMSAGRMASRVKPVIVLKGGRSRAGAAAAASHTGALAGANAIYDAAFRRAGMLRVATLRELFDAAETLASGIRVVDDRLMILTNGGGLGVLAADALELGGGTLARLDEQSRQGLAAVLPATWSSANPIDILGDARGERYRAAIDAVVSTPEADALLILNCPTGVSDSMEAAGALAAARERNPARPMIACWMGDASVDAPRELLSRSGIPNYETPDEAVTAFLHLAKHAQRQRALFETPVSDSAAAPNNLDAVRAIVSQVRADQRVTLTEPEAKAVIAAYNIPVVRTETAANPREAAERAGSFPGPVALKILSRQITHKTDVGGVSLNLSGREAVGRAAEAMLARVALQRPDAVIDGFTVQDMAHRPQAQELLLGVTTDSLFGPCLMFGQGGVATEIIADRCIGLPPLNANLAADMVRQTRVSRLLAGYRDRPPVRLEAVTNALVALSDLVIDFPEIADIDINPLLADGDGVVAVDARIILRDPAAPAVAPAIRPYPAGLAKVMSTGSLHWSLRPIRPGDARGLLEMARRTDAADLRLRFHGGTGALSDATAARLSQIDYDREMALVVELPDASVGGVVRLVFDPDFETAECAIIVRSDITRHGVGHALLKAALAYAASRGAGRVWGDVMADNERMLTLARELGGAMGPSNDPTLMRVTFAGDALLF